MIDDIKFLYYLFTNYTFQEIKILFKTVELLPFVVLENFQKLKT